MSTDYLLWQWSLTAQAASALMIVGFLAALRRSFPTAEVRVWTEAWAANLLSLAVTFADLYWVRSEEGPWLRVIFGLYIAGKAWFVVQMAHGLWLASHPGAAPRRLRVPAGLIAALGVGVGLYVHDYTLLSLLAQTGLLAGFVLAILMPTGDRPVGWLLRGLGLRALLSAVEALVYAAQYTPPIIDLPWPADTLARFSAVSSSFDMLTEWLIAIGCVLAATGRAHRELAATNDELHRVQASLRAMVDVDALTGLASRGALRDIARSLRGVAAGVLFLDLRGFKAINDKGGHQAGDAALRTFAAALRESFRPEDATVRYGGDEFVVVARSVDRSQMIARLDGLRARLAAADEWTSRLDFDAGYADLSPDGAFEDAIRTADLAMYDAKATASRAPSEAVAHDRLASAAHAGRRVSQDAGQSRVTVQ